MAATALDRRREAQPPRACGCASSTRCWALPVSDDLVALAGAARRVAVVEDNVVVGGIGSQVELALRDAGLATPLDQLGIPKEFLQHALRGQLLDRIGLTPDAVAGRLRARLA